MEVVQCVIDVLMKWPVIRKYITDTIFDLECQKNLIKMYEAVDMKDMEACFKIIADTRELLDAYANYLKHILSLRNFHNENNLYNAYRCVEEVYSQVLKYSAQFEDTVKELLEMYQCYSFDGI